MKRKSDYDEALDCWHRWTEVLHGRSGIRGASGLMDKAGYLGGTADELCPATERGREKIRELVAKAIQRGWCKRHYANTYEAVPYGKFSLPEAFCGKCGKRPSYCKCV
jgi:hypothetical protein